MAHRDIHAFDTISITITIIASMRSSVAVPHGCNLAAFCQPSWRTLALLTSLTIYSALALSRIITSGSGNPDHPRYLALGRRG